MPAELPDADALVREVGWNQTKADWQIFLDLGTVRAIRDQGRVIATAATLPYGGRFGWISMVLVSAAHRRQGIATRLLLRCRDELVAAGLVPVLDATPAGRKLYPALGFEDAWGYHRFKGEAPRGAATDFSQNDVPGGGVSISAIADTDWGELCAYDAQAFGADRGALLARMRGRLPPAELVARRNGKVAGFLLGRDGGRIMQVGPLVGEHDMIAQALLARAFAALPGPVYLDFADSKTDLRLWLEGLGFSAERALTRMIYKRSERFDDPVRTFAVVGPEFG